RRASDGTINSAPNCPPFAVSTTAMAGFTVSLGGQFRLRWWGGHGNDTALPQALSQLFASNACWGSYLVTRSPSHRGCWHLSGLAHCSPDDRNARIHQRSDERIGPGARCLLRYATKGVELAEVRSRALLLPLLVVALGFFAGDRE